MWKASISRYPNRSDTCLIRKCSNLAHMQMQPNQVPASLELTNLLLPTNQPPAPTQRKINETKFNDKDRKFNIVVFGIPENPKGCHWNDRAVRDINSVSSIISRIDNSGSITSSSIRDCYRLGKFNETNSRSRSILVKLNRALDVSTILSKRGVLKGESISIKPDLSANERATESVLLQQRWSLIQSDINRDSIKIRGNRLYINRRLHGQVINNVYTTNPLLSDHAPHLLTLSRDSERSTPDSVMTKLTPQEPHLSLSPAQSLPTITPLLSLTLLRSSDYATVSLLNFVFGTLAVWLTNSLLFSLSYTLPLSILLL